MPELRQNCSFCGQFKLRSEIALDLVPLRYYIIDREKASYHLCSACEGGMIRILQGINKTLSIKHSVRFPVKTFLLSTVADKTSELLTITDPMEGVVTCSSCSRIAKFKRKQFGLVVSPSEPGDGEEYPEGINNLRFSYCYYCLFIAYPVLGAVFYKLQIKGDFMVTVNEKE